MGEDFAPPGIAISRYTLVVVRHGLFCDGTGYSEETDLSVFRVRNARTALVNRRQRRASHTLYDEEKDTVLVYWSAGSNLIL